MNCTLCDEPLNGETSELEVRIDLDGGTFKATTFHWCHERCARSFCSIGSACIDQVLRQAFPRSRLNRPATKVPMTQTVGRSPSLLGRLHDTVCGALLWLCDRG